MRINDSGAPLYTTCSKFHVLAPHRLTFYSMISWLPSSFSPTLELMAWFAWWVFPFRAEDYLERRVQSAFCFVRYSVTQIAAGKQYPQSPLESLFTFRRNKVVENVFVPTLLYACFLVGDSNSIGDAFMMHIVVFQVQFCLMCKP